MDFRGKKFEYVEYAVGYEGNRGKFIKLKDIEKAVWTGCYENKPVWRTMYSYCDINNLDIAFGPYYFESDIPNFEINRKVVLYAVNFLNVQYDIPLDAFKFKFTNKSIWTEIVPSVMGIRPSYYLNEIFKEITLYLNKVIYETLGIPHAFDTNVYSPRQLSRVIGSYLPQCNRYVIELTYYELANYSYSKILDMAKRKRKLIHPSNNEFNESEEAKNLFNKYKQLVYKKNNCCGFTYNRNLSKERLCLISMKENGVEKGNRNIALFYASIDKRDKGINKEQWEEEAYHFMRNFDKDRIDSTSQIRATIKSAYKDKYVFSCRKIRENMPEHCQCENCPYATNREENVMVIHRKQIEALLKANASPQTYKDLFYFHYYKNTGNNVNLKKVKKIKDLKKLGIITDNNEINPAYQTGSYIKIPLEFINYLENFKSEIILYTTILYCSYNGTTLNPKMKLQHYADKIGKSLRTIQRQFKTLKENCFISNDNKISFTPIGNEDNKPTKISNHNQDVVVVTVTDHPVIRKRTAYEITRKDMSNNKKKIIIMPKTTDIIDLISSKLNIRLNYDYRLRIANNTNKMAIP